MPVRISFTDSAISAMDKQFRFLVTGNSTRHLNSLSLSRYELLPSALLRLLPAIRPLDGVLHAGYVPYANPP